MFNFTKKQEELICRGKELTVVLLGIVGNKNKP